jgi:hypothetical protein
MGIDGVIDQDIGDLGQHDFPSAGRSHHRRHPRRQAPPGRPAALPAPGLVGKARRQDLLVFRRQRRLLAEAPGLGRIEGGLAPDPRNPRGDPLAGEIRIFRVVERHCGVAEPQHSRQRNRGRKTPLEHETPPGHTLPPVVQPARADAGRSECDFCSLPKKAPAVANTKPAGGTAPA